MDIAHAGMEERAESVPGIVAVASLILALTMLLIMIGIKLWVINPVKGATKQVDELVEGIRNNEGDHTPGKNCCQSNRSGIFRIYCHEPYGSDRVAYDQSKYHR